MKDFFKQCLKDLEPLTGIRQLFFLQSDLEDGERKKDVLIDGMITTSAMFPYIPEETQKKIIREMMVKDQDYDSLNSRVIHKWLNQNKEFYYLEANKAAEAPRVNLSEEESERIDQLAQKTLASLAVDFSPSLKGVDEEMKKIQEEDKERQEGKKSFHYKPDPDKVLRAAKKMEAAKSRGLDKLDLRDLQAFVVSNETIMARTLEEAQEIYVEVYMS